MCPPLIVAGVAAAEAAAAASAAAAAVGTAAAASTAAAATAAAATAASAAAAGGVMGTIGGAVGGAIGGAGWGTALSLGSAGFGMFQSHEQAKDQKAAVQSNLNSQTAATNLQQQQTNQQATDKMSQVALESLKESGRIQAIAGDTGAEGVSTDRLRAEVRMNEGSDIATLESNRINANNQSGQEAAALSAQSQSKLNSIKQPSLIGAGLQIAGGLADDSRRTAARKSGYNYY